MADVGKETSEIEAAKAAMDRASSISHEVQIAFGGMSAPLLAVLGELREIKAKLPGT